MLGELCDPRRRSAATFIDLACLLGHFVGWLVLPLAFFPWQLVVGLYALSMVATGVALFAILAPGHYPDEAACLSASERTAGTFFLRQTACTVDFRTGPFGALLCSGLQYQIEHHLFPTLSHVHYPKLAPLVRALCERHGLPHRTLGWGEAIVKSVRVFRRPKRVVTDVRDLLLEAREVDNSP